MVTAQAVEVVQWWNWGWWLLFAGTAGVISAVLSSVLQHWFGLRSTLRTEAQKRSYLALRLAVALEEFASDCATSAGNADTWVSSRGAEGNDDTKLPALPVFPDDPDAWLALQPDLANRCLTMRNTLAASQGYIWEDIRDLGGPDKGMPESFQDRCLQHGLTALKLASDLRGRNNLPDFHPEFGGKEWMLERQTNIADKKRLWLESRAKLTMDQPPLV